MKLGLSVLFLSRISKISKKYSEYVKNTSPRQRKYQSASNRIDFQNGKRKSSFTGTLNQIINAGRFLYNKGLLGSDDERTYENWLLNTSKYEQEDWLNIRVRLLTFFLTKCIIEKDERIQPEMYKKYETFSVCLELALRLAPEKKRGNVYQFIENLKKSHHIPLVYKAGLYSIITLAISGKTNEKRDRVYDASRAKFRAKSAYVVDIEDLQTKEAMKSDHSRADPSFIYRVGEEIKVDNYNEDINEVCTTGIHYFKTKEVAEDWWIRGSRCHKEGLYREWHDNGRLELEFNCKDGELNGLYRRWYEDGTLSEETHCKDGKREGLHREYDWKGTLFLEVDYKNGSIYRIN
jgi:Family of unknown function (DUF5758)